MKDADSHFERVENKRQFFISEFGKRNFENDLTALKKFANEHRISPYYLRDLASYYHDARVNLK